MKPKQIVSAVLLLFIVSSVGAIVYKRSKQKPELNPTEEFPATWNGVAVYYFHGKHRCESCDRNEKFTDEAVQKGFKEHLVSDKLRWRIINTDKPENRHYIKEYDLVTQQVILAKIKNGAPVSFKNLTEVGLDEDGKAEYIKYIQDAIREGMRAAHD